MIIGVRGEITYSEYPDATIQDRDGNVIYDLASQGLRAIIGERNGVERAIVPVAFAAFQGDWEPIIDEVHPLIVEALDRQIGKVA